MFDNLAISGIPLIVIVFALVEMAKTFGLQGRILTFVSLLVGFLLYFAYVTSTAGLPADFTAWLNTLVVGLMFGLSASGIYNFMNSRLPMVQG